MKRYLFLGIYNLNTKKNRSIKNKILLKKSSLHKKVSKNKKIKKMKKKKQKKNQTLKINRLILKLLPITRLIKRKKQWFIKGKTYILIKRYYHVFKKGELEDLIKDLPIKIVDTYYDHANWCVVIKKL